MTPPVAAVPAGVAVVALALAADVAGVAAILRGGRWTRVAALAALATLATPAAVVAVARAGAGGDRALRAGLLVGVAAVAAGLVAVVAPGRRRARPALVLVGVAWTLTTVDLARSGGAAAAGVLGFRGVTGPVVAGALAGATGLALASGLWGVPARQRVARRGGFGSAWTRPRDSWLALAALVVVATVAVLVARRAVVGEPVVVAVVAAGALLLVELGGWRVRWRGLILLAGAAATVVGVVALVEVTNRPAGRPALGVAAEQVLDRDGWPDAAARVRVAGGARPAAGWVLLLPGALAVVAVLASPRRGVGRDVLDHVPGSSAHAHAAVLLVVLGWVADGLGPPAVTTLVSVPWVLVLVLARRDADSG